MANMNDQEQLLDPPSFELPSDFTENPSDYELWSLRVPSKFDVSNLDGRQLQIQNLDNLNASTGAGAGTIMGGVSGGLEAILTSFQMDGTDDNDDKRTYNLSLSQPHETQSFRILTAKQSNNKNNDDDDENSKDKKMIPLPIKFHRNLKIIETSHSNITDLELAPSTDRAPNVNLEKERMRIPYTPIDQKKGLKKRWNVFGSNMSTATALRVVKDVGDSGRRSASTPSVTTKTKRKVSDDVIEEKQKDKKSEKKKKKKAKKSKRSSQ